MQFGINLTCKTCKYAAKTWCSSLKNRLGNQPDSSDNSWNNVELIHLMSKFFPDLVMS